MTVANPGRQHPAVQFRRTAIRQLSHLPQVELGHYPTPIEPLDRLSAKFPGYRIRVKRDDCTGLGLGGNKVRQIEFYLGDALSQGCDTVLSTGAVQSNCMRTIAAATSKLGMDCHIQLENRVSNHSAEYQNSGNKLLTSLFGAHIYYYPAGEDEEGADRSLADIADKLKGEGRKPYIIPLRVVREPKGAFGYMVAAQEMLDQFRELEWQPDLVVVGSGSGLTHAGLLTGLRLLQCDIPVLGVCVRRHARAQSARIKTHCENLANMLDIRTPVTERDIWTDDSALAPGYGQICEGLKDTIRLVATTEGLLLDPVYSGKAMRCMLDLIANNALTGYRNLLFIHTGGTPAIFAYRNDFQSLPD